MARRAVRRRSLPPGRFLWFVYGNRRGDGICWTVRGRRWDHVHAFWMQAMIGAKFGTWVIDRELGRGGMGEVYLAHRATPGDGADRAALKVLSPGLAQDPAFQIPVH